jgi:hypothetical protein
VHEILEGFRFGADSRAHSSGRAVHERTTRGGESSAPVAVPGPINTPTFCSWLGGRPGTRFFGSSSCLASGDYEHRVVDKLTTLRMTRGVVVLP